MSKDRFMFFANFDEMAHKLPDELRLRFYDALMDYVFRDIEPEDPILAALIVAIKPSLDKEESRGGAREGAGRRGKNQNNFDSSENQTKSNEIKNNQKNQNEFLKKNENQKNHSFLETETEAENKKQEIITTHSSDKSSECVVSAGEPAPTPTEGEKEKNKKFIPPTVEQVFTYCRERGNSVNAEKFVDFYQSKGWLVGKSKMKDWRAAVRNWEREEAPAASGRKAQEPLAWLSEEPAQKPEALSWL